MLPLYDQRPAEAVVHELRFRIGCSFEEVKELIKMVRTAVVFGLAG